MPTKSNPVEAAEIKKLQAETAHYRALERRTRLQADELEEQARFRAASEYHNRIYTFDGPVQRGSVADCIGQLGLWRRQDPAQPIQIVFNSPGGSVFDGLALYDFIQELRGSGTRVDTMALGMAASMGGVLLQAGEERVMSRHSYLLIHEVSSGAIGSMSELEDEVKFSKRLQNRLLDILAERSTLSADQIARKWKRKDWWLDAHEAHELGFCDEVR